jgi:hypothetical protein
MKDTIKQSDYSLVNNVTGEVLDIDLRVLGTNKSFNKATSKKFFKFMDVFTEEILLDKTLSGKAIKLLFWILKQLDFGETTFILNTLYASESLGVSRKTLYNWKNALIEKGIIQKITGELYTLNPDCVMYGNVNTKENASKVLKDIKNAKILKGVEFE